MPSYRRSNCTVARRSYHDHHRTQPPQPPRRWRHRPGNRGFRAPAARTRARHRTDPFDVGRVQQLPQGRGDRGSDRQGWLLDEWHRTPRRRRGSARRAGIQIWAHTTEGQEHEPQSHGATLTDKDGAFRLEMPQIIPIFGQPHGHLAYDSGEFKTVFLRPVMRSAKDTWRRTSSFSRSDRVGYEGMRLARVTLIWALLAAAVFVPIAAAAASPLLEWRGPVYILAGFAGIIALGLMLVQPLLIAGYLPGLSAYRGRRAHHWIGGALVVMVVAHIGGLWITSPPDMIDALLFTSPTPFSPFGVIAAWAIFAVALLAALRRRLGLRTWRIAHMSLAVVIVVGSVVHGMLVEGTMETMSKAALCALVLAAAIKVMADLWMRTRRASPR